MLDKFYKEKEKNIKALSSDKELKKLGNEFIEKTGKNKYSYNFSWLGRPIIQFPQDMIALQEIIWESKPDLIIETGIAHGGSLIFSASILEMIGNSGEVVGIDIDIREHNRRLIEEHFLSKRIKMIQGSSVNIEVISKIKNLIKNKKSIMVILDSNHTHDHVLEELNIYSKFVSKNNYLIVFDTSIEDMPVNYRWGDRPWGKGNNPRTAVNQFLMGNKEFIIDNSIDGKLIITVATSGYLKKIR